MCPTICNTHGPGLPGFGLSTPKRGYRFLPEEHADAVTLIMRGNAHIGFRTRERERREAIFTDRTTVIVEGAGPYAESDAPEEFVAAIRGWASAR
ncbi:hypothetical protein [Streptomyces candidus]|uniref:Uncharacterized protein n=1 Tax=Streptomyces candidus TaxID=67283 RepID=A0A7X0HLU0_9ACTN|nr:hypothetical protein [Streptomyces candidus]MBB6438757.1 hypothetical protein [Streptomyces candidus]GHH53107.1 hypothetical protein GCM10018773_54160 [Streptomyces candidus]